MPRFLVVLDVDSTLIEQEVIELLAEAAGSIESVAEITLHAMNGELDFERSLRERVATLAGLNENVFAKVTQRIRVTHGATDMITRVHAAGGTVCVVSGGFHEVVDGLASSLGLDYWRANRLEVSQGVLTGMLTGPIIDSAAKASALREWASQLDIPLCQTIAVGEWGKRSADDGCCWTVGGFNAKAPVRDEVDLVMDRRDLSQLLPLLALRS